MVCQGIFENEQPQPKQEDADDDDRETTVSETEAESWETVSELFAVFFYLIYSLNTHCSRRWMARGIESEFGVSSEVLLYSHEAIEERSFMLK